MISSLSENNIPFEELFKTNYTRLCNAANKILDDRIAAEDIVQEVFLKLWNKREELNAIQSLNSYLYKATINTALNYLESNRRTVRLEIHHEKDRVIAAEDRYQLNELESKINTAVSELPPKCKVIFLLSRHEGLKYQQIADHLDISVKTVENQMGKALKIMRDRLKPYLTKEVITLATLIGIAASMFLFSLLTMFLVQF